jgi:tripartite-type tricarboxylate transporter receptor subunit TctC
MKENNGFSGMLFPSSALIFLLLLFGTRGWSQDFPTKPITIYIGMSAGASVDLTARALAEAGQKELKVPVVVENKTGGGGTVAASLLASKKPDGYSLGVLSSSVFNVRHLMMPVTYDPVKDFTQIFAYGVFHGGICVRKDSPFKTIKDLLEYARAKPGTLTYSSSGIGDPMQLAVDFLAKQAKVSFKQVPFAGGTPAITALIGGHVDFTAGAGSHLNYVKQGEFRMLVLTVADGKRNPEFPNVPTIADLGYKDVPPPRYLLVAPKGMPTPVYRKVEEAFTKAAHSPEFRKVLGNLDVQFSFKDGRKLEEDFPEEYKFFDRLLNEMGVERKKDK